MVPIHAAVHHVLTRAGLLDGKARCFGLREEFADMLAVPTHEVAVVFVSTIELVVSLLCKLAANGIEIRDAHPGNFGMFAGDDVRVIDWADAFVDDKPEAPWQIWRKASIGFRRFKRHTEGPHRLNAHVTTHPEWAPIVQAIQAVLEQWQGEHHHDPLRWLNRLGDRLAACAFDANLAEAGSDSSGAGADFAPACTIVTLDATSADQWLYVAPNSETWVDEWHRITSAVQHSAFADIRARLARRSLYTNDPKRLRSEYDQGRSGSAEIPHEEYKKIYAVSVYVWQYIQHDRFRERFESQPPPKAYSDVHKFEQWLFKKIRQRIAGSKPTEAQLWSHLMSALRQAWGRRGQGLPECGWRGWHFAESDFVELERAARGAFSAGWGVLK